MVNADTTLASSAYAADCAAVDLTAGRTLRGISALLENRESR